MKNKIGVTHIFTWLSVLMILVMIVMLFTPSWEYETKERDPETKKMVEVTKTPSISGFVWFPKDHKDLTKQYEKDYDTKMVTNDEVTMPALLLVLGVALSVFALIKPNTLIGSLSALGLGLYSVYGYMTSAFIKTSSCWSRNLTMGYVAAGVGLVGVVFFVVMTILKKKKKAAKV